MNLFPHIDLKELLQIPSILVAIGTIVAGLIAAAISIINMVISKENKVSELRQEWVNGFRDEISKIVSSVDFILFSFEKDGKIEKINKTSQFLDNWLRDEENKEESSKENNSKQCLSNNYFRKIYGKKEENLWSNEKSFKRKLLALYDQCFKKIKIEFDNTPISIQEMQIILIENKKSYKSFLKSYKKAKLWLQEDIYIILILMMH